MRCLPLACLAALVLAACGSSSDGAGAGLDLTTPTGLSVTPALKSMAPGDKVQFTAIAVYADGTTREVTAQATWESSSPDVGVVNAGGVMLAKAEGKTTLNALFGTKRASAKINVVPASELLVSFAVSPSTATMWVSTYGRLHAFATYADGHRVDVTGKAYWLSANPGIVTVSRDGEISAYARGTTKLTAEYHDEKATTAMRVLPSAPSTNVTGGLVFAAGDWGTDGLGGVDYDAQADALFYTRTGGGTTTVNRYRFASGVSETVYSYASQADYGLRVIDHEAWVVRTLDNTLLRLGSLPSTPLTLVGSYNHGQEEIDDVALAGSRLYLVNGDHDGTHADAGLVYVTSPAFTTPAVAAGPGVTLWPALSFSSIVPLGSGTDAKVAVTTGGYLGSLEIWSAAGKRLDAVPWLGWSHLQVDAEGRIYAYEVPNIYRLAPDLSALEVFRTDASNWGSIDRFALRETASTVEMIVVPFRSHAPRFTRYTLPR